MTSLLKLAERCEKATGPDRELDKAMYSALVEPAAPVIAEYGTWPIPKFTASLDAAMTLVPAGWTVANLCQSDRKGWWAELRHGYLTSYDKVAIGQQLENATPALALCAAALRATEKPS